MDLGLVTESNSLLNYGVNISIMEKIGGPDKHKGRQLEDCWHYGVPL